MAEKFGYGQMTPTDSASEFNVLEFIILQTMAKLGTAKLVRVEAVHAGATELDAPTVDVLPLVQQLDGNGNAVSHGTVFGLPVLRLQAGACAIILDPAVGDVGLVVCADRDISNARENPGKEVTPGSFRQFDLADGVYIGATLNAAPTCYVRLKSDGLKIADAFGNVLETSASGFALTGNVAVTGNITATGDITSGQGLPAQVRLRTHTHSGVTTGAGVSGAPVPGT